jgi:hypothetical protein
MKKRNDIMTFRLPEVEKAKLVSFAEAADVTISDLAVKAVRDLIATLEAADATPVPAPKKKK